MGRIIIIILVLLFLMTSSLSAQSLLLNDDKSATGVFGGFIANSDSHYMGLTISAKGRFDFKILFYNDRSIEGNINNVSIELSYLVIKNNPRFVLPLQLSVNSGILVMGGQGYWNSGLKMYLIGNSIKNFGIIPSVQLSLIDRFLGTEFTTIYSCTDNFEKNKFLNKIALRADLGFDLYSRLSKDIILYGTIGFGFVEDESFINTGLGLTLETF